jgi:type IV pilus assembly protein PilP
VVVNRPLLSLLSLLSLLVLLLGCGEPIADGSAGTTPAPAKPAKVEDAAAEAPVEQEVVEAYYYNPAGKRDPFQGFLNKSRDAARQVAEDAPPLQRWDVEKFALKGVIWATSAPSALLVDPDGLGHVVRVGTYVGRNWGKVSSISPDGVVVTEEYQTLDGELVVNPVQIRFPGREI